MTGLAIVQHQSAINGSSVPGSVTLGSTPTAGNLLVVFIHCQITTANITINTSKWTQLQSTVASANTLGITLYRYVQMGDTTTAPAFLTAGSGYWAYELYEISGVSGTIATDIPLYNATNTTTNASSLTSAKLTTTVANALALYGAGQYDGGSNHTATGWSIDENGHNASNYGSDSSGHQAVTSSGTAVSVTVGYGASHQPCDLMTVVLQLPGTNTETGTVTMDFSGSSPDFAFAGAGTVTAETAGVNMAFGGIAMSAADVVEGPGTAVLAFGPIALIVAGFEIAASKIRQFWTK